MFPRLQRPAFAPLPPRDDLLMPAAVHFSRRHVVQGYVIPLVDVVGQGPCDLGATQRSSPSTLRCQAPTHGIWLCLLICVASSFRNSIPSYTASDCLKKNDLGPGLFSVVDFRGPTNSLHFLRASSPSPGGIKRPDVKFCCFLDTCGYS